MGLFKRNKVDDPHNILGFWPSWVLPAPGEISDEAELARFEKELEDREKKKSGTVTRP